MSRLIAFFIASAALVGCGTNIFTRVERHDPAERALAFLDEKKPDAAIDVLADALEKNPEDWTLVSLMASAKAQKAGVDTTDIALKMATKEEGSGGNAVTSLFTVLPAATPEHVALMKEAVDLLDSIPVSERVDADLFKLSMYNTSYMALQTKSFDGDGDGKFSVEELKALGEDAAIEILSSLINAESAASAYSAGDSTGAAASKVGAITAKINAQEGATTSEKLKNYLGTTKAAVPATP